MGTKGAPQYFRRIMIDMLQDCPDICEVCIDDIFIFGKSEEELLHNTDKILKRLHDHFITVNPRKTYIGLTKLNCLGLTLTRNREILVNEK